MTYHEVLLIFGLFIKHHSKHHVTAVHLRLASALHGVVRCLNNAVERLHHSSTMYVVLSATRVASIAVYAAATVPMIVTAALVAAESARRVPAGAWVHGAVALLLQLAAMAPLAGLLSCLVSPLPGAALVVAAPAGPLPVALLALALVGPWRVPVAIAGAAVSVAARRWCAVAKKADGWLPLYASLLCVVLGGCAAGNWGFGLLVGATVLPSCLMMLH